MASQPVWSAGHQAARLGHDAESPAEVAQRVERPDNSDSEADIAAAEHPEVGAAAPAGDDEEAVEHEAAHHGGRDRHRLVIFCDRLTPDRVDDDQETEEGHGEDAVEQIHRLRPVQLAVEDILHSGEGELRLDSHQESKDADGQRPSDDEGHPVIHLVWRFSVNSSIFLLSLGRQTGLQPESDIVFRSPSSPI